MYIQIQISVPDPGTGAALAETLLKEKLAACIQVLGPMESHYVWEEKVEKSREWLLLIKTRNDQYPALERAVTKNHPYEVPELITLPIEGGLASYLSWIDDSVNKT